MKSLPVSKRKIFYLAFSIILNIFSCLGSLFFLKTSQDKLNLAPFNFLWEFFTVNWCVWNSIITCAYNVDEISNEYKKVEIAEKKKRKFGFFIAVSNLIAMLVFTANVLYFRVSMTENKSWFWWTNCIVWHYVAPIISLTYFFRFVKIKKTDLNAKNLFYLIIPVPVIFFFANIARRFLADPQYLEGGFKKFLIPPFELVEKGKLIYFVFFVIFALLTFWLFTFLLLKIKERWFTWTIKVSKSSNKKNYLAISTKYNKKEKS